MPAGPANSIEPGGPDQGQPTHFLPRRNQFVFRIRVPRDFGNRELIWTLTSNGKTEKAYGSLKPDYVVNATVMAANFGAGGQTGTVPDLVGNVGPVLKIEGELTRRVKVGEPVSLIAVATDDGKPRARPMQQFGANRTVPNSATGLRLVWLKYRGAGEVTFDPPQFSAWEDTRDGANSPWASGWRTPADSSRQQVGDSRHLQDAGPVRSAMRGARWRPHGNRERHGRRHSVVSKTRTCQ